jgi:very-short-patch-repair endonuclease
MIEAGWDLREAFNDLRRWEVTQAGDNQRKRWIANKAYEMRLSPTEGELAMWRLLQEMLVTFIPQHILGRYIVDFYCPDFSLIIEVDGSIHRLQQERDLKRQLWLSQHGFNGFRVTNQEVLENRVKVRNDLQAFIESLPV